MLARLAAALVLAVTLPFAGLPVPMPRAAAQAAPDRVVFINEIHYDNRGPDIGELVEVAGPVGTDLSGHSVVLYDGDDGTVYATDPLAGSLGKNGVVVVDYPVEGIQNGPSDAVALVDGGRAVQFLSWGGVVTATDGPASGLSSTDIALDEGSNTAPGSSLQLTGTGSTSGDFTWTGPAEATPGGPNVGQSLSVEPVAGPEAIAPEQADILEPGDVVEETVPPSDSAVERIVEGESLADSATGASVSVQTSCCGIVWSENQQLRVDAARAGDATVLTLQVPENGRYALGADLSTGPGYGTVILAVDGDAVGAPFEGYASSAGIERRVKLGDVGLAAGPHTVTVTVTGRAEGSTGWLAGVDLLRLRQLPDKGRLTLTPHRRASLRGAVPVYGWSTEPTDDLRLQVDGQDIVDWPSLGDTATLLYEAKGIQAGPAGADFADGISVRGQETILFHDVGGSTTYATDGIDISEELLFPGQNEIVIFTGPDPAAGADSNKDDFNVRNVRLLLADGTVLRDEAMAGTYLINDANPQEVFTFTIAPSAPAGPVYTPARGYTWDTTTVEDGRHTVALVADGPGGRERLTSTVTVDNGVPQISALTPADGARVKGEVRLDATVHDGRARRPSVTATLDGEAVELGSIVVSDDLADGEHTFTATATDAAGNTATATATFTSIAQTPAAPQLLAPEDGATGVPTSLDLRVRASDPAGDPLEVTFLEAIPVAGPPGLAAGGTTSGDAPATLVPRAATPVNPQAVAVSDDEYADAPATTDFPYQRYDIRVTEPHDAKEVDVSWEGRIAADREIVLSVYDVVDRAWTEVASSAGVDGADTTVVGVVRLDRALDKGLVHVLVQGRDPFADIPSNPDAAFEDASGYDFSVAWTTDTQYLSQGAEAGLTQFAEAFQAMNRWIVDNAAQRKIAYAAHTGDIINDWSSSIDETPEYLARAEREFQFASDTMAILDDAGMPNGVVPGNHDNRTGVSNDLYNRYFPPSRYDAAEDTAPTGEDGEGYYGGSWRPDDNQNHFDLIETGRQKLIFVYVGYLVGPEEIAWANGVLADHRDRKAVVLTHSYLLPSTAPDGRDADLTSDDGLNLFEQVVLPNENVFLTLSGHTHGVALNIKRDAGAKGRTIVEMLANYQFFEVAGERRTGFLRLLQFNTEKSQVSVNTFSPVLGDHNTSEFDTEVGRSYVPGADEFVVPVDLATRSTAFRTDSVGLALRTNKVIGRASVASGDEATVTWSGLTTGKSYGWYARATDEFRAAAESTAFTFTTGTSPATG